MAVTATVTATKIDITSTGGAEVTFGEVVTAVNAVTAGTITGSGTSGDPYTITAATYRELEISANCNVTFEANTYVQWQWSNTSGTYVVLDMASGSTVTMEEGVHLDFGYTGTYRRGYIYLYGALYVNGTSGNGVEWSNYRSFYDYSRDHVEVEYLTLKDPTYSSGYMYHFENYATLDNKEARSYNNVTVTDTSGNQGGRIYMVDMGNPVTNTTWADWTVTDLEYIYLNITTCKLTRWNIESLKQYISVSGSGHAVGSRYETSKDDTGFSDKYFQPSLMFDNCTIGLSTNQSYILYVRYGSQLYLKNCTFLTDNILNYYGSRILEYGDENRIGGSRIWNSDATYLRCREIGVKVQDSSGNPIEGATVILVQQPDRKEEHCGFTNSDGKLLDMFGNNAKVVQREETSANNFEDWSNDLAGGTAYHSLVVSKYGYGTYSTNFEATEDREYVITLYEAGSTPTTLIGCTLYSTVLY